MSFTVFGPYRGITGYDTVVRNFLKGFDSLGYQVKLLEFQNWSNLRAETDIEPTLKRFEDYRITKSDYLLNFCLLDQTKIDAGGLSACYTMFESDKIPRIWVENALRLDTIIVPTEWNKQVFIDSGIPANKLLVCEVPLDIKSIQAKPPTSTIHCRGKDISIYKNRFLFCGEFIKRKNVSGLVRAWIEAVGDRDDSCLVIKLNSNSGTKLDFLKEKLGEIKSKAPIFLVTQSLTTPNMMSLYHWCTHYISMTFGEGWGMSETICGVLGKKVIAPESSAYTSYLNSENSYLIKTKPIPAIMEDTAVGRYYLGSNWFAPIKMFAIKAIRESIEDTTDKGSILNKQLIERCDHVKVAEKLHTMLSEFRLGKVTQSTVKKGQPLNILMTCKTLGSQCGIADYTTNLTDGLKKIDTTGVNVGLAGNETQFSVPILELNNINVWHLQLEYQFVSPTRLGMMLEFCKNSDIHAIITMHTVNPRAYDYHEVLYKYRDDCTIVVSSNLMKETLSDFTPNGNRLDIRVIPMGIDSNNIITPIWKPTGPIGFFGFCYEHKGISRVLDYAQKNTYKNISIFSTKPFNDNGYFDSMWNRYRNLQHKNVIWNPSFLPENMIVSELSKCSFILLPYSEYGGIGVSAAIRTVLKAGIPIITFDNSFFKDIVSEYHLLNVIPPSSKDMDENVKRIINSYTNKDYEYFIHQRDLFVKDYSWENMGRKHLKLWKEVSKWEDAQR